MMLNQEQSRPRPTLYLVIKLTCGLVYDIAEAWGGLGRVKPSIRAQCIADRHIFCGAQQIRLRKKA